MSTDDIGELWSQDAPINENDLVGESKRIPMLHSKYYDMYYREALRVKKLKYDYRELEKAKTEYYNGSMDELEMKDRGWKPFQLKVLRQDIDRYVQSDKDIITISLKIDYHTCRADYLENIVRTIHSRNFIIKNMVDIIKFQHGDY